MGIGGDLEKHPTKQSPAVLVVDTTELVVCIIQNINGLVTRCSSLKRNRKPIGERASSKLGCPVSAGSHAATKPKARSPMGFLLSGLPVLRTIASTPVVVARKESVTGMQPCD